MPRALSAVAALLAVALLVTGCNRSSTPDADEPSEATSAATGSEGTAAKGGPLQRGLQAHVDGDLDAAVAAYQEVLGEDPENKLALYNLGLVEQSRGNNEDAEKYYRSTLEVDAEYTPALFNLAILRTAGDDDEEAVELYQRVVDIDPKNAGAYLNLGFALQALGRDEEAEEAFNTAIELDPSMQERITGG